MKAKTARLAMAALAVGNLFGQGQSLDDLLQKGVVIPPKNAGQNPAPETPPQQRPQQPQQPPRQQEPPQPQPRQQQPPANDGYRQQAAPQSNAFRMNLPPQWRAQLLQSGAVVAQSADGSSTVVIAPVPAKAGSAADFLRQNGSAALRQYLNGATVTAVYPSRLGGRAAMASAEFRTPSGPGRASVLCFLAGGMGTMYIISAPTAVFAQQREPMIQMLKSFSFSGSPREGQGGAAPGRSAISSFTPFRDPAEGAFTTEVPAGWKTQGGMVRKSTVDVRAFVHSSSPDGMVFILVGDPQIGTFVTPTQTLAMGGMNEGATYGQMRVRRYVPGPAFAQEYATYLARSLQAGNLQFKTVRPRPDLSGATNSGPAMLQATAGEASFSCIRNGREYVGMVLAATQLTTMPSVDTQIGMWNVTTLMAFLATPEQIATASDALAHIVAKFQVNPQWFGQQQQTTMRTSQITREASEHMARTISDSYWSRQRVQDRTNRNFSDSIRGTVRLRDPETGEELEGTAGSNYYGRIRNTGQIVGSDSPIQDIVHVDVTELEQIR